MEAKGKEGLLAPGEPFARLPSLAWLVAHGWRSPLPPLLPPWDLSLCWSWIMAGPTVVEGWTDGVKGPVQYTVALRKVSSSVFPFLIKTYENSYKKSTRLWQYLSTLRRLQS